MTDIDDCFTKPCVHGICEDQVDGFICLCEPGFNGTLCDNNIDDCYGNPCIYGTCTDEVNGFTCSCLSGYEGDTCAVGKIPSHKTTWFFMSNEQSPFCK